MANPKTEIELPNCPVRSVVVYSDRAEVTRIVETTLSAGEHEIQFKNISKALDKDSVRVDGIGSASIVEVSFHEIPVTQEQDNQDELKDEVSKLEEEIVSMQQKRVVLDGRKDRLKAQFSLLEKYSESLTTYSRSENKSTLAKQETVDSFFSMLDTYEKQSIDLNTELFQLEEEDTMLSDNIAKTRKHLDSLKPKIKDKSDEPLKQPVLGVLLAVKEKGTIKLMVSYIVSNASWTPKYDLRVTSAERTMEVGYFGMVQQNTGEDWNEAKLSLSTATPSIGGNAPELETCKINLIHFDSQRAKDQHYRNIARFSGVSGGFPGAVSETSRAAFDGNSSKESAPIPQAQVTEGLSSSIFEITALASIPSDNSAHKVSIAVIKLKPTFEYETVPKLSQHAFLKAKVKNDSRYSLLAGPANVFLDQAFVTKSSIPNVSPMEQFGCSLGADPSVKVVYKPVNKYREESGLISVSVIYSYKQVTEITNTRKEPTTILFTDHIPLSKDDKLKVNLVEPQIVKTKPGQAPPNPNLTAQNHITWSVDLRPEEMQRITVHYTVEYPKNKQIEGL